MRLGQGEDGHPLGDVGFQPIGEVRMLPAMAGHEGIRFGPGRLQRRRVPDSAQLLPDAVFDIPVRGVVHGVLCQMEPAALPRGRTGHCAPGGFQASVIIRDTEPAPTKVGGFKPLGGQ